MTDDEPITASGAGPGWPDDLDLSSGPYKWVDGRALTGVVRDSLAPPIGSFTNDALTRLAQNRGKVSWNPAPEPDSAADIGQAVMAKTHLTVHAMPLLARAQLLGIEPFLAQVVPFPVDEEQVIAWASAYEPPASPLFVDCEREDGDPVVWEADTWPFPFHLRAALVWSDPVGLSVIPFGSVSGCHLIGGTDYQPWMRLVVLREQPADDEAWPEPGLGDVLLAPDGSSVSWVALNTESHCAHQASIATNLAFGALSLLLVLDRLELPFAERPLPRSARRRARRADQRIGWIPVGLPDLPVARPEDEDDEDGGPDTVDEADLLACPARNTHARLDQAHTLWHEAMDAYQEPDLFATKLNALLTSLRSVTFVMQKELKHTDGFDEWYEEWRKKMAAKPLMRWSLEARNAVEKRGDLDAASVAAVRITGDWTRGEETVIDVDPAATPSEIARRVRVSGHLPLRVRREGVLVIERRWTVPELEGREILDALAECFGLLAAAVNDAHRRAEVPLERCELTAEEAHHAAVLSLQPSGRPPCMAAGRETRTSRRALSSGAPIAVGVRTLTMPTAEQLAQVAERYGLEDADRGRGDDDHVGRTRRMHEMGRRMLLKDGFHRTIVWMTRGDQPVGMTALDPEDQRDKFMMIEKLADDVTRLGADAVTFATEMWEAPAVAADDPRARLRPEERDDRIESFTTVLVRRDAPSVTFRSQIHRNGEQITLGDAEQLDGEPPTFLQPVLAAWQSWPT